MVEIWKGLQKGARNAGVCEMQIDKHNLKGDLNLWGEDLSS